MTWEKMVFVLKTYPFNMSMDEIKNLNFHQVHMLFSEWNKARQDKVKEYQNFMKRFGKDAFPVVDIARGICD